MWGTNTIGLTCVGTQLKAMPRLPPLRSRKLGQITRSDSKMRAGMTTTHASVVRGLAVSAWSRRPICLLSTWSRSSATSNASCETTAVCSSTWAIQWLALATAQMTAARQARASVRTIRSTSGNRPAMHVRPLMATTTQRLQVIRVMVRLRPIFVMDVERS